MKIIEQLKIILLPKVVLHDLTKSNEVSAASLITLGALDEEPDGGGGVKPLSSSRHQVKSSALQIFYDRYLRFTCLPVSWV